MLSMSAFDGDSIALGSPSDALDLGTLIQLDAMSATQDYQVTQKVAFLAKDAAKDAEPIFHATFSIGIVN